MNHSEKHDMLKYKLENIHLDVQPNICWADKTC